MYKLNDFYLLPILVFALILGGSIPSFAQEDGYKSLSSIMTDIDRDKAKSLREDAARYREQAKGDKDRAQQYKELEANARQYAEESSTKIDREMWLEDADRRAKAAQRLEESADNYLQRAEAAKREADILEGKVSEQEAKQSAHQAELERQDREIRERFEAERASKRNEDTCQLTSPNDLIGLWLFQENEDAEPFAIVQQDPEALAYPNNLELHSFDRTWSGTFNGQPDLPKDEPRITFKYKPQPREMNPEIPDWAQAGLDTNLEWELEVWAECDDGALMPYAKFFPGKVRWYEDTQEHEIIGRGEGRKLNFIPSDVVMSDAVAESSIGINLGVGHDPYIHPVEGLTKRQRFFVEVKLPTDLAKETGDTIEVTLTGKTGGESDTIELRAGGHRGKHIPVRYTQTEAITIADSTDWREADRDPQFLSIPWIFNNTGDRIDLDVENEEIVEVQYQDLIFEVPIYNSWVQRGIARHKQAADQLQAIFSSMLSGPYSKEQKESAHLRMRLITNYRRLLESDAINDLHRYDLGALYLGATSDGGGFVHQDIEYLKTAHEDPQKFSYRRGGDGLNDLQRAYFEGLSGKDLSITSDRAGDDIVWTTELERQKVLTALWQSSRKRREELMEQAYKNLSFGLYQGLMMVSTAESYYIVFAGKDAFNRKVRGWERLNAALGLGSQHVMTLAGIGSMRMFNMPKRGNRFGLPKRSQVTYEGTGSSAIRTTNALTEPTTGKNLTPAQRQQTFLKTVDEPAETANQGVPSCAKRSTPGVASSEKVLTLDEALEVLAQDPVFSHNPEYLKHYYPGHIKVVEDYSGSFAAQSAKLPSCQAKSLEWIIKKRTGFEVGEAEMHRLITYIANKELRINPNLPAPVGYGLTGGYPNWMIRKLGRMFGMKVSEVAGKNAGRVSLRAIKRHLEQGSFVKAVLEFDAGGMHAYHAISVEDIAVNSRGFATRVRFFDPNVAAVLELPAADFKKMLLKKDLGYGNVTVFQ